MSRYHIYSQELTKEVLPVSKTADTGITYYGIRIMLASPDILHHTPDDDDRSAVTFWIPNARSFTRGDLAGVFDDMATLARNLPDPEPNELPEWGDPNNPEDELTREEAKRFSNPSPKEI